MAVIKRWDVVVVERNAVTAWLGNKQNLQRGNGYLVTAVSIAQHHLAAVADTDLRHTGFAVIKHAIGVGVCKHDAACGLRAGKIDAALCQCVGTEHGQQGAEQAAHYGFMCHIGKPLF